MLIPTDLKIEPNGFQLMVGLMCSEFQGASYPKYYLALLYAVS